MSSNASQGGIDRTKNDKKFLVKKLKGKPEVVNFKETVQRKSEYQ